MTTPAGVAVEAKRPDGEALDITEGVQALYDLVVQSMDWGSGFLSSEEVEPIVAIAEFCGFKGFEEARRYFEDERQRERLRTCLHPEWAMLEPNDLGYVYKKCLACGSHQLSHRYAA